MQEIDLIKEAQNGSINARDMLIDRHMGLIVKWAKKYKFQRETLEDTIQNAILGFMRAIELYKEGFDNKLTSYAEFLVRRYIYAAYFNSQLIYLPRKKKYKRKGWEWLNNGLPKANLVGVFFNGQKSSLINDLANKDDVHKLFNVCINQRQKDIIGMLYEGHKITHIATKLNISRGAIRQNIERIKDAFNQTVLQN